MQFFRGKRGLKALREEMFNLEAGALVFKEGKLEPEGAPSIPSFNSTTGRLLVKPSSALLFLPSGNWEELSQEVFTGLLELEKEYRKRRGVSHLSRAVALETGSEHFFSLKFIPTKELSRVVVNPPVIMETDPCEITKELSGHRFIWFLFTLDQLLLSLESWNPPLLHPITQLVSLVFDPTSLFPFEGRITKQLVLRDALPLKPFRDLMFLGEITPSLLQKLGELSSPKEEVEQFLDLYSREGEFEGVVFSNPLCSHSLILSVEKGGAFELVRGLGDWKIYRSVLGRKPVSAGVPGRAIRLPWEEVRIQNPDLPGVEEKNRFCSHCVTPLYGEILVVGEEPGEGRALCLLCASFFWDMKGEPPELSDTGTTLWEEEEVLTRTRFPREAGELVELLQVDSLVKKILHLSFSGRKRFRRCKPWSYLLLETEEGKHWVAWAGTLTGYTLRNPLPEPPELVFVAALL